MKIRIEFKDPDAIQEIICAKVPCVDDEEHDSRAASKARDEFAREYFDHADYGFFEIDTDTMIARLVPRKEWK